MRSEKAVVRQQKVVPPALIPDHVFTSHPTFPRPFDYNVAHTKTTLTLLSIYVT